MGKEVVFTDKVGLHIPAAIATKPLWSLGVKAGPYIFASGQPGVDANGAIVAADTQTQTRQALDNLKAILEAGGLKFGDIAKIRIFTRESEDYERVNDVRIAYYEKEFPDGHYPASTFVVTGPLAVEGLAVEVEAFACSKKRCYDSENIVKLIPLKLKTQPRWRLGAVADDLLWTTGQPGLDMEANLVGPDAAAQTLQCMKNTGYILESGGYSWRDVVKLNTYISDVSVYAEMLEVRNRYLREQLPDGNYPTSTTVHAIMPPPGMLVEIEAVARKGDKQIIHTSRVASTVPLKLESQPLESQAIRSGNWVFLSGQTALGADGQLVGKGDIRAQTAQTLANIETLLTEAGASFADIVHVTLWLKSVGDYEALNEVRVPFYRDRCGGKYPASTAIGGASPHDDVLVQMEIIAWVG